ncbi:hypothetical protein AAFN46_09745 [Pseudomonas sp. CAU 1711]|uniref:hypothetical protein n=1 Tax=Pseudomonas sp. CAU 1711 TaxID=3140356 RepID=UPI0032619D70
MRLLSLALALACSASAQAQAPGAPGTATPQPYAQPRIDAPSMAPRNGPPLLVKPGQPSSRVPVLAPQVVPRDRPLPALQLQRRQQQAEAAEALDNP